MNPKNNNLFNYVPLIRSIENIFLEIIKAWDLAPVAATGRPRVNILYIFRGLMFMLLRGHTWREFQRKYGTTSTAHRYMTEWAAAGVFHEIWKTLLNFLIDQDQINLKLQVVDGAEKPVKNMLHVFTGMGYKHKSKQSIKITLLTDSRGIPFSVDLSKAHHADSKRLKHVLNNACVQKPQELSPQLIADKGYTGEPAKKIAAQHGLELITPHKTNACTQNTRREKRMLKKRNIIERTFARLFQFKRLDKILDKTKAQYESWLYLAFSIMCTAYIK